MRRYFSRKSSHSMPYDILRTTLILSGSITDVVIFLQILSSMFCSLLYSSPNTFSLMYSIPKRNVLLLVYHTFLCRQRTKSKNNVLLLTFIKNKILFLINGRLLKTLPLAMVNFRIKTNKQMPQMTTSSFIT